MASFVSKKEIKMKSSFPLCNVPIRSACDSFQAGLTSDTEITARQDSGMLTELQTYSVLCEKEVLCFSCFH